MKILKLFCEVKTGEAFYFENPNDRAKLRVKSNGKHYVSQTGRHLCNPHVLVFQRGGRDAHIADENSAND